MPFGALLVKSFRPASTDRISEARLRVASTPISDLIDELHRMGVSFEAIRATVRAFEMSHLSHGTTWDKKERDRIRKRKYRDKIKGNTSTPPSPVSHGCPTGQTGRDIESLPFLLTESVSKKGIQDKKEPETELLERHDWPKDYEVRFWEIYPRRIGKATAMKALAKVKKSGAVEWSVIVDALEKFSKWAKTKEVRFVKHPATWLNAGCWDDELVAAEFNGENHEQNRRSLVAAADRLLASGFKFKPKPGTVVPEQRQTDIKLLPKG